MYKIETCNASYMTVRPGCLFGTVSTVSAAPSSPSTRDRHLHRQSPLHFQLIIDTSKNDHQPWTQHRLLQQHQPHLQHGIDIFDGHPVYIFNTSSTPSTAILSTLSTPGIDTFNRHPVYTANTVYKTFKICIRTLTNSKYKQYSTVNSVKHIS